MKIRAPQLLDRATQVAAEARNAERVGAPRTPDAATLATVDAAVAQATQKMAGEIVEGRGKHRDRDRDFSFSVLGFMRREAAQLPPDEEKRIWEFGGDHALQDKVEAQLTTALAAHGLKAEAYRFSTANYDGILEVQIRGVSEGAPAPTPEAMARVTGAGGAHKAAPLDAKTSQKVHETTARLLDDAAAVLSGPYTRAAFDAHGDPALINKVTVALEKAARQLSTGAAAGGPPTAEVQQSYVRLLYALSDAKDLYGHAVDADDRAGKAPAPAEPDTGRGFMGWLMDGLRAGKGKGPAEATGGFERRVRAAVVSLYDSPPLGAVSSAPKATRAEQVQAAFSLATPEMLRDPSAVATFAALAATRETAANAELIGDHPRAKHAHRDVAADLAARFGPALVTAQALAELGDFSVRSGQDDRASRAYVGALRVMLMHLPSDHALVRETAHKLESSGQRWLASIDTDKAEPMRYQARSAMAEADGIRKELGLDAILAQKGPAKTELAQASAGEWSAALDQAQARGARPSEQRDGYQSAAYRPIHYAIFGPMRDGW